MYFIEQICSFEQAKKLKSLGVEQDSLFSWFGDENHIPEGANEPYIWPDTTLPKNNQDADHREDTSIAEPIAAAFSTAELGKAIPPHFYTTQTNGGWIGFDDEDQLFPADPEEQGFRVWQTEALLRADIIIALIELKINTVAQINNRLTEVVL